MHGVGNKVIEIWPILNVMIPFYHYMTLEVQPIGPLDIVLDVIEMTLVGHITQVDQDVSIWNVRDLPVENGPYLDNFVTKCLCIL